MEHDIINLPKPHFYISGRNSHPACSLLWTSTVGVPTVNGRELGALLSLKLALISCYYNLLLSLQFVIFSFPWQQPVPREGKISLTNPCTWMFKQLLHWWAFSTSLALGMKIMLSAYSLSPIMKHVASLHAVLSSPVSCLYFLCHLGSTCAWCHAPLSCELLWKSSLQNSRLWLGEWSSCWEGSEGTAHSNIYCFSNMSRGDLNLKSVMFTFFHVRWGVLFDKSE